MANSAVPLLLFVVASANALRSVRLLFLAVMAFGVSGQAGTIFNNGAPDNVTGFNITAFRVADDFVLGASASIRSLEFWFGPGNGNPVSDFSGTVTYAFYNNTAGALGSLISSGTVSGLVPTPTGGTLPVCNLPPNCPVQEVQFNLVASVPLVAGTYWLELHEGNTLTANDGTRIAWASSAQTGNAKQDSLPTLPATSVNREVAFRLFDTAVPEPGSIVLLTVGLVTLAAMSMRGPRRNVGRRA